MMKKLSIPKPDVREKTLEHGISFVSGFSPSIFQQIMSGKTGLDLMFEKLDSPRYECIR